MAAISAFTRVFDALWRPSKDAAEVATLLGPSSFEARWRSHLRMTGNKEAPSTILRAARYVWSPSPAARGRMRRQRENEILFSPLPACGKKEN